VVSALALAGGAAVPLAGAEVGPEDPPWTNAVALSFMAWLESEVAGWVCGTALGAGLGAAGLGELTHDARIAAQAAMVNSDFRFMAFLPMVTESYYSALVAIKQTAPTEVLFMHP